MEKKNKNGLSYRESVKQELIPICIYSVIVVAYFHSVQPLIYLRNSAGKLIVIQHTEKYKITKNRIRYI